MKIISLVLIICSPLLLQGQMQFQEIEYQANYKFGDKEVRRIFKFKNDGDYAVTFNSITSSCGCTTTSLDKLTYLPGEEGEIEAIFTIGQREGFQRKKITVLTDDSDNARYELILEVNIPKIAEINTRLLYWKKDESLDPKTITIDFQPNEPIKITDLKISNDSFNFDMDEVLTGKKYIISVDPGTARNSKNGNLLVKTDFPKDNPKIYFFHLRVQ
jgi:hypothetical protein